MSKYKSREELFKASRSISNSEWTRWIDSLLVSATSIQGPLYHISFDDNLPSTVKPRPVFADSGTVHEIYNEPLPPRISTASTILGCWRGIYANFSDLFEKDSAEQEISIYVYLVKPRSDAKVLLPTVAQQEWLLYDAHMTGEYSIFGTAEFINLGELILANTSSAPDRKWDTFHPFDKDKYKKLFCNPPFKVLRNSLTARVNLEQYTPKTHHEESNMDNIYVSTIQENNKDDLEYISMEALSNPLKGMTDRIKDRLHRIVSSLSSNNGKAESPAVKKARDTLDKVTEFNVAQSRQGKPQYRVVSYTDLRPIVVTVPVGFSGNLVDYSEVLANQCRVMANLTKEVLEPTHNLILKYIGKPETMTTISNSDFGKIKLHTNEIEKFKKDMNRFFSTKHKHQTQPIGSLIKNVNQLQTISSDLSKTIGPYITDTKNRAVLFRAYTQLQQSIDLLLVRIEQKPEQYQLNKLNAERLASLINDVAIEIELYSAMFAYCDQHIMTFIGVYEQAVKPV